MQTLHVYYPIFKKYNILYATFRIPGKKKVQRRNTRLLIFGQKPGKQQQKQNS